MRKIDKKLKKIQRSLFKIIIENYWIRNKLTRHMNQAGGIKPELQLRGENNRSNRKDRSLFVSNTNDTKLILKAKKKLLPFYLIRWLTRASSLRIRRTLVEMALFIVGLCWWGFYASEECPTTMIIENFLEENLSPGNVTEAKNGHHTCKHLRCGIHLSWNCI